VTDFDTTLRQLQHGDSFFPSGSIAFSFGLETLLADGHVSGADGVESFLVAQLGSRWATMEWGFLAAAWEAVELPALLAVDAQVELMTFPRELREGSKRAGAALLTVHNELATAGVAAFSAARDEGVTPGHLTVVQGMAWKSCGLARNDCGLLGAHTFSVAVLGSALRLGMIGHLSAQKILTTVRPHIVAALEQGPPVLARLHAYTPVAEIAVMRHEMQASRLFSN
jgi:urease accessory protein